MSYLIPLKKDDLPSPPPLKKLIGPSFILLGLGLGSGELILWPYLSANFGLGIIWASVIGITFQFFLNMEIARYTLINGESIFVGLTRKYGRTAPAWFILSTLIPWMWPGIIASSATLFAAAFGYSYQGWQPALLLFVIGIILSLGTVVYKTQERLQKTIILIGVPFVFILAFYFADISDWQTLVEGLVGRGQGYRLLPAGIPFATLLGAFAYAGAGGNLNLAQSYYIKEKGYGMGKFAGRITSVITGKKENISLEGTTFNATPENLIRFNAWWKRINIEHALVFWFTGALTMVILSLLAFTTVFGQPDILTGIKFVIREGEYISRLTTPVLGTAFLLTAAIMLFGTQFSVFGSTARIMSENLCILSPKFKVERLSRYFYVFLWLQILLGSTVLLIGFSEPLTLVIISAVFNAITMFVYSGLVILLNLTKLDPKLRPSFLRICIVLAAFLFYGGFSIFTLTQYF